MRSDVRLRVVDIASWDSPVAKQYGIRRLPTLWLFRDGREVSRDTAAVLRELSALR
jgi:thioredoxin-like negative regulator of GroEL